MPDNYKEGHRTGPGTTGAPKRVRFNSHSTTVPNAVLLGYAKLSDGARLTYMVLESYDWPDKDGFSKGCCWPSIETIAVARSKSYDSIARHLKELETAGLIRVESGQERGMANCYWLLGPSQTEFAAYLERFPETASQNPSDNREAATAGPEKTANFEEAPALVHAAPQKYGTGSGKHALPGSANMPEKEHEFQESNSKKLKFEKDSNHNYSRKNASPNTRGDEVKDQARSTYISLIMRDFSISLNDLPHSLPNESQVQGLFRRSGMDEQAFVELLYEAKDRTKWASLTTPENMESGPNRAAYFFTVVRSLLEERRSASATP